MDLLIGLGGIALGGLIFIIGFTYTMELIGMIFGHHHFTHRTPAENCHRIPRYR